MPNILFTLRNTVYTFVFASKYLAFYCRTRVLKSLLSVFSSLTQLVSFGRTTCILKTLSKLRPFRSNYSIIAENMCLDLLAEKCSPINLKRSGGGRNSTKSGIQFTTFYATV